MTPSLSHLPSSESAKPLQPRFLTTGEAARYCGVHLRTIIRWIEKGALKAHKLPGRGDKRIQTTDLLAFMAENQMPIPPALSREYFSETPPQPTPATQTEATPKSPTVLLVDDDRLNLHALTRVLSRQGYEVLTASDGFMAGTLLGIHTPDVMLLDLMMPGISGFEVLKNIQGIDRLRDVNIIVMSGLSKSEMAPALELGAHHTIEKPFDGKALIALIQSLQTPKDLP